MYPDTLTLPVLPSQQPNSPVLPSVDMAAVLRPFFHCSIPAGFRPDIDR